jgi:hypothetical protein
MVCNGKDAPFVNPALAATAAALREIECIRHEWHEDKGDNVI